MTKFSKRNYFRIFLDEILRNIFLFEKSKLKLKINNFLLLFFSYLISFFKKGQCLLCCIKRDLHNSDFSRHYGR